MPPEPGRRLRGELDEKLDRSLKECDSCRLLSGGGLMAAGAYVYSAARARMRPGCAVSMGTMAQITFAFLLASMGFVFLVDPVGRMQGSEKKS